MNPMKHATLALLLLLPSVAFAAGDGVPFKEIGFHAFNLMLLLGFLAWFVGPKAKDALANRAAKVKADIDSAEQARDGARQRFEALEARLSGFEQQLAGMRQQAEKDAAQEQLALQERAQRDAALVASAAERTIGAETAKARQLLRKDAAELAVKLAGQTVKQNFGAADQDRFAQQFLGSVGGDDTNGNGVGHG